MEILDNSFFQCHITATLKSELTRDKTINEFWNYLSFYHDYTTYSMVIKMAAIGYVCLISKLVSFSLKSKVISVFCQWDIKFFAYLAIESFSPFLQSHSTTVWLSSIPTEAKRLPSARKINQRDILTIDIWKTKTISTYS